MRGVFNSENDFTELSPEQLERALKQEDYLVALLQTAVFRSIEYKHYQGEFDHITLNDFRKFANAEMQILESKIYQALESFNERMSQFRDQHNQ